MFYTFNFIGEINTDNINALNNCVNSIENLTSNDTLTININSTGGNVSSGIAIFNIVKKLSCNVVTHNLGEVSSAAILLYMAGKTRTAADISKFIIHPLTMNLNTTCNYYQLKELFSNLETDINNYLSIVTTEMPTITQKYDILNSLKCEALLLTKDDAVACGIVTNP